VAKEQSERDAKTLKEIQDRLGRRRWLIERNWWGNILFHLGVQWISYNSQVHRWRQKKLSPSVPTPVTNLFRATLDTVKSAISQHDPHFLGTPERDDPRAVAAAASADAQLQIILKEGGFRRNKRRMLDWLTLTGNAFIEASWDDSPETGEDRLPFEQCTTCLAEYEPNVIDQDNPACPNCGGQMFRESETQSIAVPRGSIHFDTKSPFEVYLDSHISELEDQPFVLIVESYTKEQVSQKWGYDADEGDSAYSTSGQQFKESAALLATPGVALPIGGMGAEDRQNRITVYRLFCKEHKKFPKGIYLVQTAAGHTLERHTPYPWRKQSGSGKKFYPLVHFRFGTMDGRAWGYTPADDLLPKQYQLNKAESLLMLHLSRMANSVWLIPSNTNPTRITGEMGIQVEYTPVGGVKPERVQGAEAPQSLVRYIADIRQAFDELSGAFSAVRGRQVGTRTPVGTVQQLTERGFGRWATVFDALEEGYEDLAKIGLEVWRQNSKTPRVRSVRNAIGGFTFQEFAAADWDDGVDVKVEAGSTRPHTQGQKLQTYASIAQLGLLNMGDQSQVIKILEDVGMQNLLPGVEEDTQASYKENADFMAWAKQISDTALQVDINTPQGQTMIEEAMLGMPIMVTPLVDHHPLHFLTHRRLALTQEFKMLPDMCKAVFYQHMFQHKQDWTAHMVLFPPPAVTQPGVKPAKPGN